MDVWTLASELYPPNLYLKGGEARMPSALETITKTYTSFSGADIKCIVGRVMIMELQGISYSVTREKVY